MSLIFGSDRITRVVDDAAALLLVYRDDSGADYLDFKPSTPKDALLPEDLAVTILINSRVGPRAFQAVQQHGQDLDLPSVPSVPLEDSSDQDRDRIADTIVRMAEWPGFAASVATKVLHKKRPATVPILDNQAIFGAYMNADWPGRPSSMDSVYSWTRIRDALQWIWMDLTVPANRDAWRELATLEPTRTRIELFDMVWWMYFRRLEPVSP